MNGHQRTNHPRLVLDDSEVEVAEFDERKPDRVLWISARVRAHIYGNDALIECDEDPEGMVHFRAVLQLLNAVNGPWLQCTPAEPGDITQTRAVVLGVKSARGPSESLGARLRRRRNQLGWSQEKLAEKAHMTQGAVQKIENGKSLRPRNLQHIASALGVSTAWLAFGVETLDQLDPDVLTVAKAWSGLSEPTRSKIKETIFRALNET